MNKLTVPENISLRTEFWRGFGAAEAARSGAVLAAVLAVTLAVCAIRQAGNAMVTVTVVTVFTVAFCAGFFGTPANTNQSIYDFLKIQAAYRRERQAYPYRKREEVYELVWEEEES
jgi:hypothetical protein